MKLSIIIPAYNCVTTLDRAVNSALNQTMTDLEIIIVDDGSTDGTYHLSEYLAQRWTRVRTIHIKNSGPAKAREAGVKEAKGSWIGFLDADDELDKKMYETLLSVAEKENVQIAQCNFTTHSNGIRSRWYWQPGRYKISDGLILSDSSYDIGHMMSKVYKRDLFDDVEFPDCDIAEDVLLNVYLYYKAGELLIIDDPLYHYYINDQSLAHSVLSPARKLKFLNAMDKMYRENKNKKKFMKVWETAQPFLDRVVRRKSRDSMIDVVVPYVSMDDPVWRRLYTSVTGKRIDKIRFRDNGLFPTFWRAIETNLQNYGVIHLVVQSMSQVPDWLDTTKVRVVTHEQFMFDECLPVFNSTAIEMFLQNIPGLADRFIYFNDDFYPLRKVDAKSFFDGSKPKIQLYECPIYGEGETEIPVWKQIAINSSNLACQDTHTRPAHGTFFNIPHVIRAYNRRFMEEAFVRYYHELMESVSALRQPNNINIFFFSIYAFTHKQGIRATACTTKVIDYTSFENYQKGTTSYVDMICLNDTEDGDEDLEKIVEDFKAHWYRKSNFEKYDVYKEESR